MGVDAGPSAGDGADGCPIVYAVVGLELLGPVLRDGGLREEDGEVVEVGSGVSASVV